MRFHTINRRSGVLLCATIIGAILFVFTLTNGFCEDLSRSLPSQISTTNGQIFTGVKLIKVLPNGLVIQYFPTGGGTGLATLKFKDLPAVLQKQFGYNPTNAAAYEKSQAATMIALSKQLQEDEKTSARFQAQLARPVIIWKISEPTVNYFYYDSAGPKPSIFGTNSQAVSIADPHFTCEPNITFRWIRQEPNGLFVFYFDTVTIPMGLSIDITLAEHPYNDIILTEEGRRKLYGNIYKLGHVAVRHDIEVMVYSQNPGMTSTASDMGTARTEVRNRIQSTMRDLCISRIERIAREAGDRYVEIHNQEGIDFQPDNVVQMLTSEYGPKVATPALGR